MPRPASPANSDSEDSAPELVTLSSTKKESRSQAEALNTFEAAQKAKRKRENRARNAALQEAKARAREERAQVEAGGKPKKSKQKRGKQKEDVMEADVKAANAEERMERAMREAAEEDGSDSQSELEPDSEAEEEEEEWTGISASDMDIGLASANHLPEHLFSAAAAQPSSSKLAPVTTTQKVVKKKRKKIKAKDLIVGSRTLRTLAPSQADTLTASLTLPPARINRFLKRTLQLKSQTHAGNLNKGKGNANNKRRGAPQTWERRPVNLGVLRAAGGPAMKFSRGA